MVMSVGICECGCGEFDHGVGGWEQLEEHEHDRWQKHRCDPDCVSPCLVARCRVSDGFWTWCSNCDILCSGQFVEWSDEPREPHDWDDCDEQECDLCNPEPASPRNPNWPPAIGSKIQVTFTEETLTVVERIVVNAYGDPVRESSTALMSHSDVYALYATDSTGREVLVESEDLNDT